MCLDEGLIKIFKDAGALIGSARCAGCAAGQIGQTGPGEVAVSSGNRNFVGKQGKGDIFLISPSTVAASLVAGYITTEDDIPDEAGEVAITKEKQYKEKAKKDEPAKPTKIEGHTWVIKKDNIDTDMIFHNRYLSITNMDEMGQYTFDNLDGYKDFAKRAKPSDIIIVGKNFGCGSSRQQAVDCFKSLDVAAIIAESFGSIYERNAINSAMPILVADNLVNKVKDGDEMSVDFTTGEVVDKSQGKTYIAKPFSKVQLEIYRKGDLLK